MAQARINKFVVAWGGRGEGGRQAQGGAGASQQRHNRLTASVQALNFNVECREGCEWTTHQGRLASTCCWH